MTLRASLMRVLVFRGKRVNPLPLAQERSRGLLLRKGFRDRVAATKAKAKISHPKMVDTLGLLASQGRGCFRCYQPRHLRRDCPQGQGSQSYGTPQSQSSVGHA